ncbi:MAG: hypothetical protein Q8O67_33995 [Deltaproteobacteria bacterium]|nr:hypothetical protein [Deltaproteobacteria bacterium]
MSFGFPARHRHMIALRKPDNELRQIAREAIHSLRWNLTSDGPRQLTARHRFNIWSFGELISVTIEGGVVDVESRCRIPTQCFDWGKNKRNVDAFFALLPPPPLLTLDAARAGTGAPVAAGTLARP